MAKQIRRSAESFRYVLKSDQALPLLEQTTFVLNPLTQEERRRLLDEIVVTRTLPDGTKESIDRTWQEAGQIVLSHLVMVENFPVGAPQPWPNGKGSTAEQRRQYLNEFADTDLLELYNELFRRSYLGDDVQNFSSPERTSSSGER
jgi:hypothetical protein